MRPLLVVLAAALVGCGGPTEVSIDQDFALAFGKSAAIEGTGITVTFEDVLEDSRCPINAVCVWAGNARIQLAVNTPARHVVLQTRSDSNYAVVYQEGIRQLVVQLGTLLPEPVAGEPINKRNYRATLKAMRWERLEGVGSEE
jgi:hypothetical protein